MTAGKSENNETLLKPLPKEEAPGFTLLLRQFTLTVDALREVLDTVTPHVAGLDQGQRATYSLPPMSEEGAEQMGEVFRELDEERKKQIEEEGADAKREPLDEAQLKKFAEGLKSAYESEPESLRAAAEVFETISVRPQRQQLLHSSLLAMAVGTLETAIAGVGTQHYSLHPKALPWEEKEFTLGELAEFSDLGDARAAAIARRVEDLMRSGFDAWDKWFDNLLGKGFAELAADREILHEAIQRRHLVVHNGGRVSRQYRSKVPSCTTDVGGELPIDREYLERAIDAIAIFGVRLVLSAWGKWSPEDPDAPRVASAYVLDQLIVGHNEVAFHVAGMAVDLAVDEEQRLNLQVNQWQAQKRMDGPETLREAVETWDVSALSPRYGAAKAALLDDFDNLFTLLPELIEHEELGPEDLREWPLFKEAPDEERWAKVEALLPDEPGKSSEADEREATSAQPESSSS